MYIKADPILRPQQTSDAPCQGEEKLTLNIEWANGLAAGQSLRNNSLK